MKTFYVLGFLFNTVGSHVTLLRKNRPAWQANRFNGVGGHIEAGETAVEAMIREGMEEIGVKCPWERFANTSGPAWNVAIFRAFCDTSQNNARAMEDQRLMHFGVTKLPDNVVDNLRWLIPLALDQYTLSTNTKYGAIWDSIQHKLST